MLCVTYDHKPRLCGMLYMHTEGVTDFRSWSYLLTGNEAQTRPTNNSKTIAFICTICNGKVITCLQTKTSTNRRAIKEHCDFSYLPVSALAVVCNIDKNEQKNIVTVHR